MSDYAELRAALDAGPKPGKWTWKQVGSFTTPGCAVFWPDTSKGGIHYRRLDSGGGMEEVDADLIAAASPDVIRALLAERDALREALTECLRVNETDVGADVAVWANAMLVARAALAQGEV